MALQQSLPSIFFLLLISISVNQINGSDHWSSAIEEASVTDLQRGLAEGKLTSLKLVDFYIDRIKRLNPLLRGVLEVSPDARCQAERADRERAHGVAVGGLHGIPVVVKDSVATRDGTNTSVGSYALVGAWAASEATVVERLRGKGAVILGKASMSEWYGVRSLTIPDGWCARAGQPKNPYVESGSTCGSSSGSAISVAANMAAVSIGTETDGSIICPADHNSVVGFKPTVGLTSRAGVIPLSPRQDSIGPICRTVSDAVYVLDAIVGYDPRDHEATKSASEFIPSGGYLQFLKIDGLKGKRIGVVRKPFSASYSKNSSALTAFENHLKTLRKGGATIIDDLKIAKIDIVLDSSQSGEMVALISEFKVYLNKYLEELSSSPVRSLADIIAFITNHPDLEMTEKYGQELLMMSEETNGVDNSDVAEAVEMMKRLSQEGFERTMKKNKLDAIVTLGSEFATVLAIGGYPGISVPAGYELDGTPFGVCFGGLKGTEPALIEIAFGFEQATKARKPPLLSKITNHKDK